MEILLGALAYAVVTFPLALVWHMKAFRPKYEQWRYFGDNPQPLLGLLAIVIQGVFLSYGYGVVPVEHSEILSGLGYSLLLGVFFWTSHVLAYMAKHTDARNLQFLALETIYLAIQFGVFGVLIALIYGLI